MKVFSHIECELKTVGFSTMQDRLSYGDIERNEWTVLDDRIEEDSEYPYVLRLTKYKTNLLDNIINE